MIRRDPKEVEKELRNITDGLGLPMDEGMIRPCVILNSLGFKTRQSCEGHEDKYSSRPWIDLIWNQENTREYYEKSLKEFFDTIFIDLEDFYKTHKPPHCNVISFYKFSGSTKLIIRLQQTADLRVYVENRGGKINDYLSEIQNFCEFLNKKYNLNY